MFKCSNVQMFKCSNVQMSNVKYQMSIRFNFCRSVPPEFIRSFFHDENCLPFNAFVALAALGSKIFHTVILLHNCARCFIHLSLQCIDKCFRCDLICTLISAFHLYICKHRMKTKSKISAYPSGFELKASRPPGCNGGVDNNNNNNDNSNCKLIRITLIGRVNNIKTTADV